MSTFPSPRPFFHIFSPHITTPPSPPLPPFRTKLALTQAEGYLRLDSRVNHVSLSPVDRRRGTVCCADGTSYVADFPPPPSSSKQPRIPCQISPSCPTVETSTLMAAKEVSSIHVPSLASPESGADNDIEDGSTSSLGSGGDGGSDGVTTRAIIDVTASAAATAAMFEGRPERLMGKKVVGDCDGNGNTNGIGEGAENRGANSVGDGAKTMNAVVKGSVNVEETASIVKDRGGGGKRGAAEGNKTTDDNSARGGARAGLGGKAEVAEAGAKAGGSSASTTPRLARLRKIWDPIEQLGWLHGRNTAGGVEPAGTGGSTTGSEKGSGADAVNDYGAGLGNASGTVSAGSNSALSSHGSLALVGVGSGGVGGGSGASGGGGGGRSRGPVQAGRAVWGEDGQTLFLLNHEG